ncbi:MAG: serpin family protein [Nitrosopumilus sp.]|nr:serpin family protein [Nitrosopumilus sp.]
MNVRLTAVAAAVAVSAAALYAASGGPDSAHIGPARDPVAVLDAVSASNRFAIDFYNQVSGGDGNIFFSPVGMYVAFSALYEGAKGETAAQIRDAFGLDEDADARHGDIGGLVERTNRAGPDSTLAMANALWVDDGLDLLDSYRDAVRDNYGAHAESLDLQEDGVGRVNGWMEENTNGAIRDVLSEKDISSMTRLIITNAIHFAGEWETQFPIDYTHDDYFWKNSMDNTLVEMMAVTDIFDYASFGGHQMVRLPYKGAGLSMLVLLPDDRDGIRGLEGSISPQSMDGWASDLKPTTTLVQIPKFETDTVYDLADYLKNLGVADVFEPGVSDLSGIGTDAGTGRGMHVSVAIHKGFVSVDEAGTEAAAATVLSSGPDSVPERQVFRADHPFIFAIQDDETGALLFMGRVMDPTA